MSQPILAFSSMSIPDLVRAHNDLAPQRGATPIKKWGDSRCRLVQRVAILRTRTPIAAGSVTSAKAPAKRKTPIRAAILEALAFVSHYEDALTGARVTKKAAASRHPSTLRAVGLPYDKVLARVKRRFPKSKVSNGQLRWTATMVRNRTPGFEACKLPHKRPQCGVGK